MGYNLNAKGKRLVLCKNKKQQQVTGKKRMFTIMAAIVVPVVLILFLAPQIYRRTSSPLSRAILMQNYAETKKLLDGGANPNSLMSTSVNIQQDIIWSADFQRSLSIPFFRKPTAVKQGTPVLIFVAMQGNVDVLRLLIARGALVNIKDQYGNTPLIVASWRGDSLCMHELLSKGADFTTKDHMGRTALFWATTEGHIDATSLLLKAGAKQ